MLSPINEKINWWLKGYTYLTWLLCISLHMTIMCLYIYTHHPLKYIYMPIGNHPLVSSKHSSTISSHSQPIIHIHWYPEIMCIYIYLYTHPWVSINYYPILDSQLGPRWPLVAGWKKSCKVPGATSSRAERGGDDAVLGLPWPLMVVP